MAEPAPLGGLLHTLARSWGISDPEETARLFAWWERIVGPEVAARCQPSSLKDGVLKVRTESSAWAWEMKYLSPEIVKRINDSLGKEIVKQVKPWVKPPVGENVARPKQQHPAPAGSKATKTRDKSSGKEAEQAAEIAGEVADEQVSEALRRAVLAAKRRQGR